MSDGGIGEQFYDGLDKTFVVGQDCPTGRADAAVATAVGTTRTVAAEWINSGYLRRTDGAALKKSTKLVTGETITVVVPPRENPLEPRSEIVDQLKVIADDEHYVVIDKPTGVAAHPSLGWHGPTVVGALMGLGYRISTSGAAERQGIVHRLDVGTTGIMVVAKTELGYTALKNAFRDRTPTKIYHALVQGLPDPLEGTIDAPIGRHHGHEWKFAVAQDGRESVTHYETVEAFGPATLLKVDLETGRTHQIRVHFSAMGHPLAGDLTYGADPTFAAKLGLTRQWLHAAELSFPHPATGETMHYSSQYPADLHQALALLQTH